MNHALRASVLALFLVVPAAAQTPEIDDVPLLQRLRAAAAAQVAAHAEIDRFVSGDSLRSRMATLDTTAFRLNVRLRAEGQGADLMIRRTGRTHRCVLAIGESDPFPPQDGWRTHELSIGPALCAGWTNEALPTKGEGGG